MDCPLCEYALNEASWLAESKEMFAIYDEYPVTENHVLIATKAHIGDYLDLNYRQYVQLCNLMQSLTNMLIKKDHTINGFNVGANCGRAAGQTIIHCHFHIIPRHYGDMEDPRGGIRGCIPDKRIYD